jgi:8-oxo-dGTP diphosphatase
MHLPKYFRIAAYGMIIQNQQLLLSKEIIQGKEVIKFPGGGVNVGEGLVDALKREFQEEIGIDITVKEHIYTTDFFVQSAFHPDYQVLAIYYLVSPKIDLPSQNFQINNIQFLWEPLTSIQQNILTFDTDKRALQELLNKHL